MGISVSFCFYKTKRNASPRISKPVENKSLVPCPEIMGTHLQLFFGSVNVHGNPFLILLIFIDKHVVKLNIL